MFTKRGGTQTIRFGAAPPRALIVSGSLSAAACASASLTLGATFTRDFTLPLI